MEPTYGGDIRIPHRLPRVPIILTIGLVSQTPTHIVEVRLTYSASEALYGSICQELDQMRAEISIRVRQGLPLEPEECSKTSGQGIGEPYRKTTDWPGTPLI
jgi:hypothetical protein